LQLGPKRELRLHIVLQVVLGSAQKAKQYQWFVADERLDGCRAAMRLMWDFLARNV
jgi:hypothetical protein